MKTDYLLSVENEHALIERTSKYITDDIVDQLIIQRKKLKMTQQDVANATGIQRANVARIELKKNEASLDSLVRIADSVGMKLSITLEKLQR